jgi:hypothetical protein
MFYYGQFFYNKSKKIAWRICHVSLCGEFVAIADMEDVTNRVNVFKPLIKSKKKLASEIENLSLTRRDFYILPAEMTFSDKHIEELGRSKWLVKRDQKWSAIEHLCSDEKIHQYLFGKGIGADIIETLSCVDPHWKSRGAYYHAINRFITFGLTKNALLPFGLKNTGSNYKRFDKPGKQVIKRGRGGKNNERCRSNTRGITELDKSNITKVMKYFTKINSKFSMKRAFEAYQEKFETTVLTRNSDDMRLRTYVPFEVTQTISFDQFYYHANKIMSRADLLRLKVGDLNFEKDKKDRQGSAHDGITGATHRYEVDATVLDLYVRYPYDLSGRLSLGRPVLYLVVDVYSTMIVGFYIGFDGPNWGGVSQALANACLDKVEFANRYGLTINFDNWPACHIPIEITIDNGSEYPDALLNAVLRSEIGVLAINIAAVYRGDAKGTVERKFGVLNDQFIHYQPGSIFKVQRGDQHPSNAALYDYEALMKIMITEIIYHNNSADRLKRFNWQCVVDDIDITPKALFLHSLENDMSGGRPTTKKDEARVKWAFLKEETATVRDTCVYFDGLEYHAQFAQLAGWYARARHHGTFKIKVKRARDWCDSIWHKTENGEYVELKLKNVNNESPWMGAHWEAVLHQQERNKDKRFENAESARKLRADKRTIQSEVRSQMHEEVSLSAPSKRRSIQPNVKQRKQVQKEISVMEHANDLRQSLGTPVSPKHVEIDDFDLDQELYD